MSDRFSTIIPFELTPEELNGLLFLLWCGKFAETLGKGIGERFPAIMQKQQRFSLAHDNLDALRRDARRYDKKLMFSLHYYVPDNNLLPWQLLHIHFRCKFKFNLRYVENLLSLVDFLKKEEPAVYRNDPANIERIQCIETKLLSIRKTLLAVPEDFVLEKGSETNG